jgi:KamA family protein
MGIPAKTLRLYHGRDIDDLPQLQKLSARERLAMRIVAQVLPFRSNNYVVDELVQWDAIPDDPMFRMTFPGEEMLETVDFARLERLFDRGASRTEVEAAVRDIRNRLNPHPGGQADLNMPSMNGDVVSGIQHKYRETVLVFPAVGQTCHAYCTFCFRWPQFVETDGVKFAARHAERFWDYIAVNPEVTDILLTGGDPLIAVTRQLTPYIEPLFAPRFEHVTTLRIGTKALSFWPYRFVTDPDADDLLRLFERVVAAGKHLALMAHFDHPRELSTDVAREAIRRIRRTGAEIRTQGPLLRGINDSPAIWSELWHTQVRLGCVPYYMFVERDTGAKRHFELPLVDAWHIYRGALQTVSGLGRTARGPTMSSLPGKVVVEGIAELKGEQVFVLSFLQARNPAWIRRPFFARFDSQATWLTTLRPAFGESRFFFEDELARMEPRKVNRWLTAAGAV